MDLCRTIMAFVAGLSVGLCIIQPAEAQSPLPGCARPAISTTTTRVVTGPAIAAEPLLHTVGILANGVVALFPDTVTITETTNYHGVDGLTLTQIHSFVYGVRDVLQIPDWLRIAYDGNIDQLQRDLESGLLSDRGPCP
jgi:hypothetical protein